jgi:hypothetical protein
MLFISLQKRSAEALSLIARKAVSSPAIVPARFLMFMESMALQAAEASRQGLDDDEFCAQTKSHALLEYGLKPRE